MYVYVCVCVCVCVLMTNNTVRCIMKQESSYTLLYCSLLLEYKIIYPQIFTGGRIHVYADNFVQIFTEPY